MVYHSIFIDTCILIEGATPNSYGEERARQLRHIVNAGHSLMTSITVVGELVSVSLKKDTFELSRGIDIIRSLGIKILFPIPEVRNLCLLVDAEMESLGIYGSSVTDRTHFAYALASECDYYVTSMGETRTLVVPSDLDVPTSVITMDDLASELRY